MTSTTVAPVAVLVALLSGLWLGFQLGKVDDMCSVGRESLQIGGFMIGAAREEPSTASAKNAMRHVQYRHKNDNDNKRFALGCYFCSLLKFRSSGATFRECRLYVLR